MKSLFIFFLFFGCAFMVNLSPIVIKEISKETIVVHVQGEVREQEDLSLPMYATVQMALEKINLSEEADTSCLNPNQILHDQDVLVIPKLQQANEIEKVSINTASSDQLQTLPGIGPGIAEKIIEYRNTNGFFQTLEDLMNIKGIGQAKYDKIKEHITL